MAIFASVLFQSGLEFWFSNRARGMLENTAAIAQSVYGKEVDRVATETLTMSADVAGYLRQVPIDDPRFAAAFAKLQVYQPGAVRSDHFHRRAPGRNSDASSRKSIRSPLDKVITTSKVAQLAKQNVVEVNSPGRVGALTRLDYGPNAYIYGARVFDPQFRDQLERANDVLEDYRALLAKSRSTS